MRYELQRKEACALPNILGNHSMPVHSHRWKGIAISDDRASLAELIPKGSEKEYRIEDRRPFEINPA